MRSPWLKTEDRGLCDTRQDGVHGEKVRHVLVCSFLHIFLLHLVLVTGGGLYSPPLSTGGVELLRDVKATFFFQLFCPKLHSIGK